ncbi:MAG: PhoH family protein [Bacteroidetes bacterium]|nr:PhoH family protein [Bacteroidota bacterium]MCY4225637.1 PhoH family protein [Bacteroidota bacterium]
MTETTLTLEQSDPLLLFGTHDVHLKRIEEAFPETQIIARGNKVHLRGPIQALNSIKHTFSELASVAIRNGLVTSGDLDTILAMSTARPRPSNEGIGEVVLYTPSGGMVRTKTPGQAKLFASSRNNDIVFAIGPAGTGKTYLAVALAVAALKAKQVKRIILCRPAVEAGERLGFLPGDFREKIDPYLRPLYDALEEFMPSEKLSAHMQDHTIEIVPLAFMRGRTLNSSFVILDEAQNATAIQMKMFLTRLGVNSRAIITGDLTQVDLQDPKQSGLQEATSILKDISGISFVFFSQIDVVRHRLVKDIIDAYEKNGSHHHS